MHVYNKMSKEKSRLALVLFLLCLLIGVYHIEAAEEARGRVLFISSYSYAWETVPEQIAGIRETLGEDIVLDYQFMDTKNIDTEESVQQFYERMQYFLEMVPAYDVIIVGDDAALNFALAYRQELFADIPIIFEGINNAQTAADASEDDLICGVIEKLSYENTIELAQTLYPKATQVVCIADDTISGSAEKAEFYKYASLFPDLEFKEINASRLSQKELFAQVEALGEESILIYILCSEDGDGNIYPSAESVQMLSSKAKIPIFSMVSIGMGRGFLGGELVAQKEMGVIAADMALHLLDGGEPSELQLQTETPRTFYFDEDVMNYFGIKRSSLPADAVIINHKATFFEQNRKVFLIFLFVIFVLLIFIGVLTVDNRHKRKMNEMISRANEQLRYTSYYDALTALRNRSVFMDDMEYSIAETKKFGVIMYDLDNFKYINDAYGHNEGDGVLKELASRSMTLADEKMTVYRLAGDEFIAIVKTESREELQQYAEKIKISFEKPYLIAGEEHYLHASIGIAGYPADGTTTTELLSSVDKAMYMVKKAGKNGIAFYQNDK